MVRGHVASTRSSMVRRHALRLVHMRRRHLMRVVARVLLLRRWRLRNCSRSISLLRVHLLPRHASRVRHWCPRLAARRRHGAMHSRSTATSHHMGRGNRRVSGHVGHLLGFRCCSTCRSWGANRTIVRICTGRRHSPRSGTHATARRTRPR